MSSVVETNDEAVLLRLGDPVAWRAVYDRLYPLMVAYARRRLGGLEPARDAASEALARTVTSVRRMEESGATPDAWAFGILRHVVIDLQRRRRSESRRALAVPREARAAEDWAETRDEHDAVRRAFDALSDKDREVLELRTVIGLSSEEAAVALEMKPGAVRMAHARALGRLRELMKEEPR